MTHRDEIESVLTGWDQHERDRGAPPVIDFDCRPTAEAHTSPPIDRLEALSRLTALRADVSDDGTLGTRLRADIAYLRALLGERSPLDVYVRETQGCEAAGWDPIYVDVRRAEAAAALESLGVAWSETTDDELAEIEEPIDTEEAVREIRAAAERYEDAVRRLVGTAAPFELTIETDRVDAYWSYWLDGAGHQVRLRLNLNNAQFTRVRARQFALHEVLGHGLQSASYSETCRTTPDVPWVRLLSVHAPEQTLLEGLAQALPLYVDPEDEFLRARVRLDHYTQLVRSELHLAVNDGVPAEDCERLARDLVPFWKRSTIADLLHDRSVNPLLRSYLWAYPAGIDWFVCLADAPQDVIAKVLHDAYRRPLRPADLADLWPEGSAIGGTGSPLRLRQPAVP